MTDWSAESDEIQAQLITDAVFVAAARTDVPDLLAEVERLRKELDAKIFEAVELSDRIAMLESGAES